MFFKSRAGSSHIPGSPSFTFSSDVSKLEPKERSMLGISHRQVSVDDDG